VPTTGWPQTGQAIADGGDAASWANGAPHLRQNLAPCVLGARQESQAMLIVMASL